MPISNKGSCLIQSETKNLRIVELFLKDFFKQNKISASLFNKIFLCLSEAVNNAILHGNKNNPKKAVLISVQKRSNFLIAEIRDEGEGFDFSNLKDPTNGDNIKNEYGRGIFIIKSLTDTVYFKKHGCIINFKIFIGERN